MGAIAGANMWALLPDHDPGNSAAASDLAVDVVDQKLKKAAAVTTVKVEETPPAGKVAKPAKRGEKARINKKAAASGALVVEVVKPTNNLVKKEKKGDAGDDMQAANVHDRGLQIDGAVDNKQTAATDIVPDGDELTNGREEMKEMLDALRSIEEAEEEKEFIDVVAKGGGRRRTVAGTGQTRKAAPVVEGGITGANMWALLSDDDPSSASVADIAEEEEDAPAVNVHAGSRGAKPKKRGKKTKKEKKKPDAGNSKQPEQINGHQEKETPASELEEETSEEEEEMTEEAATAGSRCRMVAWRVCRAAVAVAMLATYFQLASTPSLA